MGGERLVGEQGPRREHRALLGRHGLAQVGMRLHPGAHETHQGQRRDLGLQQALRLASQREIFRGGQPRRSSAGEQAFDIGDIVQPQQRPACATEPVDQIGHRVHLAVASAAAAAFRAATSASSAAIRTSLGFSMNWLCSAAPSIFTRCPIMMP